MKKLVFSFLLFGLAGLGGYSLWAGLTAQREYRDAVHTFGEEPDVRVLESRFERGWMRSSAETQFELVGEPGDAFELAVEALGAEDARARVGFRMSHQIEHGPRPLWNWVATGFQGAPVMAEVSSVVEFDHESRAELATVIGRVPSVTAYTVVRSGGASETRFSAPSRVLEAVTESGTRTAEWRGLRGSVLFAPDWRSFVGTVRSPGFEAIGPDFEIRANGLEWQLDVREGDGLPLGESVWRIGSLHVEPVAETEDSDPTEPEPTEQVAEEPEAEAVAEVPPAEEPAVETPPAEVLEAEAEPFFVALRGVGVGQSSEVGAGRYAGEFWIEVQQVAIGDAVYGPGEVRIALSDVDATALRKLRRTTRRLEAQAASGEVSGETASAAVAGEMMQVLPELLSQSPRLELESLSLGLPSGDLRGSGAVWFAGNGAPAHVFDVLAGLGGELDVEAPALAVDSFLASLPNEPERADSDAGLGDLRRRGLVLRDGAVYRTRARWRNGQVTINGLPLQTVFPGEPEAEGAVPPDANAPPTAPEPSMAELLGLFAAQR